jgi:hypothetical protein
MECMCVKMETWWDGKKVNNESHLQLHCICTNDNVKPIEPLSVLLPYAVKRQHILLPYEPFPSFQRYVSLTGWQHSAANHERRVSVCVGSPSVYMIPSSTFSTCFVLSGRCFTNGTTTLRSMLLTWATICCMLEGRKPYKHLHCGSWRKNKELQWHSEQMVTLQFRYMSLLSY